MPPPTMQTSASTSSRSSGCTPVSAVAIQTDRVRPLSVFMKVVYPATRGRANGESALDGSEPAQKGGEANLAAGVAAHANSAEPHERLVGAHAPGLSHLLLRRPVSQQHDLVTD